MRLLFKAKDGGPESRVTGYWLIEWKALFSIVLLRFDPGTRDAFHNHAFNAISWVLLGRLSEAVPDGPDALRFYRLRPSWRPVITRRERMHRVFSIGRSWVLSFRGPWRAEWQERYPDGSEATLAQGRIAMR